MTRKLLAWPFSKDISLIVKPTEVEGDQGIQIASGRGTYKNLNNFATTGQFRAKLSW